MERQGLGKYGQGDIVGVIFHLIWTNLLLVKASLQYYCLTTIVTMTVVQLSWDLEEINEKCYKYNMRELRSSGGEGILDHM